MINLRISNNEEIKNKCKENVNSQLTAFKNRKVMYLKIILTYC